MPDSADILLRFARTRNIARQDASVPPALHMNSPRPHFDVGTHRERYWRSIEELAGTGSFRNFLENEFARGASEWPVQLDRRSFLTLMAASFALAGLTGCTRQPLEEIVPYVRQPEEITFGQSLSFATAMPLSGFGTGVLVKSREGRPIKVDGNPLHPASLGGSTVWMQACLLDLYDPDRAKSVTHFGQPASWALFLGSLRTVLDEQRKRHGTGLRILSETSTSPTLGAQWSSLRQQLPEARWHQYEPINRDNVIAGSQAAFGEYVATHHDFTNAKVILSLDADFLAMHPQRLRYAREFTDARRVVAGRTGMNRLYVVEPTPSLTGAMADHRLPMSSRGIEMAVHALAKELGLQIDAPPANLSIEQQHWISMVARELQLHRGECVVVPGEFQSPSVHALAHALNDALGNVGRTVRYAVPVQAAPAPQVASLRELAADMDAGRVELLVILGGNPSFNAPADFAFAERLRKVTHAVHLTESPNETSEFCAWNIPRTHFLEAWSDIRSFDGTVTIMQPLIAPLFDGHSDHELLGAMEPDRPRRSGYEIVREFWRAQNRWPDFEKGWRRAVHDGVVGDTASVMRDVKLRGSAMDLLNGANHETGSTFLPFAPPQGGITSPNLDNLAVEVSFRPDPNLWDGRFANNPWLQETPKPISKLSWDNAVLISPQLASGGKLSTGDVVELRIAGRSMRAPVLVMPGQAPDAVTLHVGYGRRRAGRAGRGVGFDFYSLRTSRAFWSGAGLSFLRTSARHQLVSTQTHHALPHEDRQIHRSGTLDEFRANPYFVRERVEEPPREETLYDPSEFNYERQWGMSIDLTACIGCNACLLACNIENNIPIVGKGQVAMSREMLWLRVDTYFQGGLDNPKFHFQPVPCMHCENAPCEYVCPVEASVHDHEGLNLQVYNRCVGTRYCSNNCPYKVRRFNFLHYADLSALDALRQNPEVTVRSRGVMEKCTYCVQRISAARIEATKENRPIRDGEVRTACQEACPSKAIVFGIITDPASDVAKYKKHPLDFSMLGQLNTRPRTTYLAKLTNPNPAFRQTDLKHDPGKEREV